MKCYPQKWHYGLGFSLFSNDGDYCYFDTRLYYLKNYNSLEFLISVFGHHGIKLSLQIGWVA